MSDTTIKALEAGVGGTDLAAVLFNQGGVNVKAAKSVIIDVNGNPIDYSALSVKGPGAAANAQRVHLSDEVLAALEQIQAIVDFTKVNGAAHSAGNPLFVDLTDRIARILGTAKAQQDGNWTVGLDAASLAALESISVQNFPTNQAVNLASGPGTSPATPAFMARVADDLCVNATGAAAAALTATLPAVAGQFHYIDAIEITLYSTAARTGAATPITVTSTNLPGNPTWPFETAGAIGTAIRYALTANAHLKSAVVNTATTIVCPAVTGGLWNVKVIYRAAA